MKTKDVIKIYVLPCFIGCGIAYLAGSFIAASFNIAEWPLIGRMMDIIPAVTLSVAIGNEFEKAHNSRVDPTSPNNR